jgi:phage terminase small subunit
MSIKRSEGKAKIERPLDVLGGELSPKMLAFCREFIVDNNGTNAAIRAGYSEHTADVQACDLLTRPKVRANIERRMAAAADAAQVDAALVLSELYLTATGDPRELCSVTVDSCRYCWGIDGLRMWTRGEYKNALSDAASAGKPAPNFEGGLGFDPRKDPNPDCVECAGRGVPYVSITPSKKLSRAATRLLQSVNQKKDGSIEVKLNDRMAATLALAKITGLLKERTELTGAGGGPIALTAVPNFKALSDDELRAALLRSGHQVPLLLEGQITRSDTNDD